MHLQLDFKGFCKFLLNHLSFIDGRWPSVWLPSSCSSLQSSSLTDNSIFIITTIIIIIITSDKKTLIIVSAMYPKTNQNSSPMLRSCPWISLLIGVRSLPSWQAKRTRFLLRFVIVVFLSSSIFLYFVSFSIVPFWFVSTSLFSHFLCETTSLSATFSSNHVIVGILSSDSN